ncbi:MAG: hypothetical protein H6812_08115 [Phycisphaeraceae bacterium]|nr:hypothetical protein [Phycisphaerales bacterium]MCB9843210.1 hypothetical protein [Phycisphaeraceae bacterium]
MRKIATCTAMLAVAGFATTAFSASPKATDGASALKVNNSVSVDARTAGMNRGFQAPDLQGSGPVPGGVVGSCQCFWDNGAFDPAVGNGQGSAMDAALDGLCADDFFLPECSIYRLDTICAEMLVTDPMAAGLSFGLAIFADCNGKPYGAPLYVFDDQADVSITDSGTDWFGYDLLEVCFSIGDCNLRGGCTYWVAPYGIGNGSGMDEYYFATSTAIGEAVQLNQGHFTDPWSFDPVVDWTPVEVTNVKKRDFAFSVCVTECDLLCDNGQADLSRSLHKNVSVNLPHFRAADNFAVPPCVDYEVCMVEVCILTSCQCATVAVEIYGTDPITMLPTGDPVATLTDPKEFDLEFSTTDNTGITVNAKRLQFGAALDAGVILEGGKTYWVSIVEGGTLSGTDRLYYCYAYKCEKPADCQIKITEAAFYKPVLAAWHPYSQFVSNGDLPNELAFAVFAQPVAEEEPIDSTTPKSNKRVGSGLTASGNGGSGIIRR